MRLSTNSGLDCPVILSKRSFTPPAPSWPFGTDSLWNSVAAMADFAATDFYPDGSYRIENQKTGNLGASTVTISGGKLVTAADTGYGIFLGTDLVRADGWTPFCAEAWYAADQGNPASATVLMRQWEAAPQQGWRVLKGSANAAPNTFLSFYRSTTGSDSNAFSTSVHASIYATTMKHYAYIFNGSRFGVFVDGALRNDVAGTFVYAPSNAQWLIQSRGSYQSFRLTFGTTRYNYAGFTPDTNFGKGLP